MTVFVILVALVMFIAIENKIVRRKKIKETRARVAQKFSLDECLVSEEDASVIGLNFREQKIVLGMSGYEAQYGWNQIAAVEVLKDGVTVQQTDRESQIASALIGGALFGGVGALIGGLTGSSVANIRMKELALKVVVDDRARPVYLVTFYNSNNRKGSEPKEPLLLKAEAWAERFHAHLINAMRTAQTQQTQLTQSCSSGLAQPEDVQQLPPASRFSVVLYSAPKKIQAIKSLRRNMDGLSLTKAKALVDGVPSVVSRGLTEAEANQLAATLAIEGLMGAAKRDDEVPPA